MNKLSLKNVTLDNHCYTSLPLFFYNDGSIILLPSLFSLSLHRNQAYSKEFRKKKDEFIEITYEDVPIAPSSIDNIINKLTWFLEWVEEYSKDKNSASLQTHHNFPDTLINHYVNEVLINQNGKSESAVSQSVMALKAYYIWLANAQLTTLKNIKVIPKLASKAKENTDKKSHVKYLTPRLRSEFYRQTPSLLYECILRAGGELGVRSCENRGFLLHDFYYGKKQHKGLLSLFEEMKQNPEQRTFSYTLIGKFTKASPNAGGKTRKLYFNRETLLRFEEYYLMERPTHDLEGDKVEENSFFLTSANGHFGQPIPANFGTKIFLKVKKQLLQRHKEGLSDLAMQLVEDEQSYHILRHSFGTDAFYDECESKSIDIDNVTTTSSVMIQVAKLLGHSLSGREGAKTTMRYIRLAKDKLAFEQAA